MLGEDQQTKRTKTSVFSVLTLLAALQDVFLGGGGGGGFADGGDECAHVCLDLRRGEGHTADGWG